ncbi:MAG TPA: Hsp20/alpha crystallin family protein [Rickettsiales bacterium]|nr:Hsp20/alpha crystallin family protein [Rickettsiales bacterium]
MQNKKWDWTRHDNLPSSNMRATQNQALGNMSGLFAPMSHFFQEMERMFDTTFQHFTAPAMMNGMTGLQNMMFRSPHIDITSTDEEYNIQVEVPGMDERDLRLEVTPENMLVISGEKRAESGDNNTNRNYHRMERSYGAFQRVLSLPEDVDHETVDAQMKNGILTVTLQKRMASEGSRSRRIDINATEGGRSRQAGKHQGHGAHEGRNHEGAANANAKKVA